MRQLGRALAGLEEAAEQPRRDCRSRLRSPAPCAPAAWRYRRARFPLARRTRDSGRPTASARSPVPAPRGSPDRRAPGRCTNRAAPPASPAPDARAARCRRRRSASAAGRDADQRIRPAPPPVTDLRGIGRGSPVPAVMLAWGALARQMRRLRAPSLVGRGLAAKHREAERGMVEGRGEHGHAALARLWTRDTCTLRGF